MGVRSLTRNYVGLCSDAIRCDRPLAPVRHVILLNETATALTSASSKVDILTREIRRSQISVAADGIFAIYTVIPTGYQRQMMGIPVGGILDGVIQSNSHGLTDGQVVFVSGWRGDDSYSPPSGLALGTRYFVVNATQDALQLAATVGGSAIAIGTTPAGLTLLQPGGTFNTATFRHEATRRARFQSLNSYTIRGLAILRGGNPKSMIVDTPTGRDFAAVNGIPVRQWGDYQVDSAADLIITRTEHELKTGDEVFFTNRWGVSGEYGVNANTIYFVRVVSPNSLTLHSTASGAIANTNQILFSNFSNNSVGQWLHYAAGTIESIEVFPAPITLTAGQSQSFTLRSYVSNALEEIGLI